MGMMEKKMEAITMGYLGIIKIIWGLYRDSGKANGSYYRVRV